VTIEHLCAVAAMQCLEIDDELLEKHWVPDRDAVVVDRLLQRTPKLLGESARACLHQGAFLPASHYARALVLGRRLRGALETTLRTVDATAMPTTTVVTAEAARPPAEHRRGLNASFTAPSNLTGLPAVAIPCGFGRFNIPLSFQVATGSLGEPLLLRIADAFLEHSGTHGRHPEFGPTP